jgi:hypothetical protein
VAKHVNRLANYLRAQLRSSSRVLKVYLITMDGSAFVEITVQLATFIHSCNSNFVVTEEHLELISVCEIAIREDIFCELVICLENVNFHLIN